MRGISHISRQVLIFARSIVFAFDPTDSDGHVVPVGKQTLTPSHIWYRPCSGIWQSVWLEFVPRHYISDLSISGDATGQVNLTVGTTKGKPSHVEVIVSEKVRSTSCGYFWVHVTDTSIADIEESIGYPQRVHRDTDRVQCTDTEALVS